MKPERTQGELSGERATEPESWLLTCKLLRSLWAAATGSAEPQSRANACTALRSNHFHLCHPRLLTLRAGHLGRSKGKGGKKDREGQKVRRTEGEESEKVIEQASSSQSDRVLRRRHPCSRTKCGRLGTSLHAPCRSQGKTKANSNLGKPTNLSTERCQSAAASGPSPTGLVLAGLALPGGWS